MNTISSWLPSYLLIKDLRRNTDFQETLQTALLSSHAPPELAKNTMKAIAIAKKHLKQESIHCAYPGVFFQLKDRKLELLPSTLIGEGGMGFVYKILWNDGIPRAIKIPKDPNKRSVILEEANHLKQIHAQGPIPGFQQSPHGEVYAITSTGEYNIPTGFWGTYYPGKDLISYDTTRNFFSRLELALFSEENVVDLLQQLARSNLELKKKDLYNTDGKASNIFYDGKNYIIGDVEIQRGIPQTHEDLEKPLHITHRFTPEELIEDFFEEEYNVRRRALEKIAIFQMGVIAWQALWKQPFPYIEGTDCKNKPDLDAAQNTPQDSTAPPASQEVIDYVKKMLDIKRPDYPDLEDVAKTWSAFSKRPFSLSNFVYRLFHLTQIVLSLFYQTLLSKSRELYFRLIPEKAKRTSKTTLLIQEHPLNK